jgi:Protein of unknown function (DUF3039)
VTEKLQVRPTLRCIVEDFCQEIVSDELLSALRGFTESEAESANLEPPLSLASLDRLLLQKARAIAAEPLAYSERIDCIPNAFVHKVKASQFRGALWHETETGVWWLLAKGLRKNGSDQDFYVELESMTDTFANIAPTAVDLRYWRIEKALEAELASERQAQESLIEALMRAARHPNVAARSEVFGAELTVLIRRFDDDEPDVVEASWKLTTYDEQDRFPQDLLAFVPFHGNLDDWDYIPGNPKTGAEERFFVYVERRWTDWLAACQEASELISLDVVPPLPTTSGSEHFSHVLPEAIATTAYVLGIESIAFCGARVIAHRDPTRFPICPDCELTLSTYRAIKATYSK